MRDDIDALSIRLVCYVLAELKGALFDAGGGRDGGSYDFDTVCTYCVCGSTPIVDAGKKFSCETQLIES
jgi:hypothetical protein